MTASAPAGPASARFRCAAASLSRAEPMVGTASTVRAFLLVEDPGPWGANAVRDSRLPEHLKRWLSVLEPRHGVRPLLVRRPGARPGRQVRVFAARVTGRDGWLGSATLDDVREVAALDLSGLLRGTVDGLAARDDPLFLVCSHGRHDACCAERGRPLAAALAAVAAEQTWEVSHIGGDRFAANVLVLPHGLYYGRVSPADAPRFAATHLEGRLDLDHLRGRSAYPFPVQTAEVHLRRHLGIDHIGPLRLLRRDHDGRHTTAVFEAAGDEWAVTVLTQPAAEQVLTCKSVQASAAPSHRVVDLRRL